MTGRPEARASRTTWPEGEIKINEGREVSSDKRKRGGKRSSENESRLTKRLSETRECEKICTSVALGEVLSRSMTHEGRVDALVVAERLEILTSGTVADEDEFGERS